MEHNQCLNCNESTERNFCSNCGQKNDTHRITLKHFLFHDILHGVWHIEKGILFTIKEAMLRPGQAAINYISGKRVRYYNVFYLILLFIGFGIIIENFYVATSAKYISYIEPDTQENNPVLEFLGKYVKFIILLAIPFLALNSFLLFNKKKFLYSEHLIIFGMQLLGIIVITLFGNLLYFAEFVRPISFLADWSNTIVPVLLLPYVANGLYGALGKDYSKIGFSIRFLIYITLFFLDLKLLGIILKFFLIPN